MLDLFTEDVILVENFYQFHEVILVIFFGLLKFDVSTYTQLVLLIINDKRRCGLENLINQ